MGNNFAKTMVSLMRANKINDTLLHTANYFSTIHPVSEWDHAPYQDSDGNAVWLAIKKKENISFRYVLDGMGYISKVEKEYVDGNDIRSVR